MLSAFNTKLLSYLIGLARAIDSNYDLINKDTIFTIFDSVLSLPNKDIENDYLIQRIENERKRIIPNCYMCESSCGRNDIYNIQDFDTYDENIKSLKFSILLDIINKVSLNYYNLDNEFINTVINGLFLFGLKEISYEYLIEYNNKIKLY